MDKAAIAERLRALATDDGKRSKAARLRDVLADVELALAAGARHADVLTELNAHGLEMSLSTFETTLKRLRAKRTPCRARSLVPEPHVTLRSTAAAAAAPLERETTPSHSPADLDRIMRTSPDLAALARLAKRSRQ